MWSARCDARRSSFWALGAAGGPGVGREAEGPGLGGRGAANPLVGYGVVVGLAGTGDGNAGLTLQSLESLIARLGLKVNATDLNAKNAAAVMVTADLPPFMKEGQLLDVTVSTVAQAKSLKGGTLLMTPLMGADGEIYAVAQGNLVVGGLGVEAKEDRR